MKGLASFLTAYKQIARESERTNQQRIKEKMKDLAEIQRRIEKIEKTLFQLKLKKIAMKNKQKPQPEAIKEVEELMKEQKKLLISAQAEATDFLEREQQEQEKLKREEEQAWETTKMFIGVFLIVMVVIAVVLLAVFL